MAITVLTPRLVTVGVTVTSSLVILTDVASLFHVTVVGVPLVSDVVTSTTALVTPPAKNFLSEVTVPVKGEVMVNSSVVPSSNVRVHLAAVMYDVVNPVAEYPQVTL